MNGNSMKCFMCVNRSVIWHVTEQSLYKRQSIQTNVRSNIIISLFEFLQADMHLCAAKCCDDKTGSIDSVQSCIERCSGPVNRAQQYVQKEMGDYQGRLQRCVMVCSMFGDI